MNIQISDLELISTANLGSKEFYRVSDNYRYCGWIDHPHCLIEKSSGRHLILRGKDAEAIQLCNGKIDCSLELIPTSFKDGIKHLTKLGYIEACEAGRENKDPYVLYQNREINFLTWAVTGGCNLKCRHCFLSAPNAKYGELTTDACMRIIDDMANCGVTNIAITGGEPLFRNDIRTLIKYITNKGIVLSGIATNGTLVTDSFLDFLEEIDCHPQIKMSYDGVNGWHDWLRGIPGSERLLISAYQRLYERGFHTGTSMTVHKGNSELIFDTIQKMTECHSELFKANVVLNVGEWGSFAAGMEMNYKELFESYLKTIGQLYAAYPDGMPLTVLLNRFITINKGSVDYRLIPVLKPCTTFCDLRACESTYRRFHISGDGRIQPCLLMSSVDEQHLRLPFVQEKGLVACMNDPAFLEMSEITVGQVYDHNSGCKDCKYSAYCAGGCRAMGCIEKQSDYLSKDISACLFFKGGYIDRVVSLINSVCPKAKCINFDI